MTPELFYLIALPFIAGGALAGIINTCLQYYDIILDRRFNNEKPLTIRQFIKVLILKEKFSNSIK